jgi:hypothetical protein
MLELQSSTLNALDDPSETLVQVRSVGNQEDVDITEIATEDRTPLVHSFV